MRGNFIGAQGSSAYPCRRSVSTGPTPMRAPLTSIFLAALLSSCASAPQPATVPAPARVRQPADRGTAARAVANLASASGGLVSGRVQLEQVDGGVRATGTIGGLVRNGAHGLQVHERGDCSAVDAASAGRYYDP